MPSTYPPTLFDATEKGFNEQYLSGLLLSDPEYQNPTQTALKTDNGRRT